MKALFIGWLSIATKTLKLETYKSNVIFVLKDLWASYIPVLSSFLNKLTGSGSKSLYFALEVLSWTDSLIRFAVFFLCTSFQFKGIFLVRRK